jgi:hypothetical protein
MSKADQFRKYAEEAMCGARQSKTEKERQALIELACTWTQAAVQSEHIFGVNEVRRSKELCKAAQSAPSSGGSMDTTTLLIIIIVLLILFGGGWYGRGRWF